MCHHSNNRVSISDSCFTSVVFVLCGESCAGLNDNLLTTFVRKRNMPIQEYERAVIFRLGRLLTGGARGPGVFFMKVELKK